MPLGASSTLEMLSLRHSTARTSSTASKVSSSGAATVTSTSAGTSAIAAHGSSRAHLRAPIAHLAGPSLPVLSGPALAPVAPVHSGLSSAELTAVLPGRPAELAARSALAA